ncbi:MAG: N-6 DNA methylase, partial [Acidobacteriota bacterium]|nr:N-6 DNA methylase [Acidobacteriota bacterium]
YEAISSTTHPKAQTFFSQWKILFGEVCGYDVDNPSERVKKLAEFYGIEHRRGVKPAELLFAVHSYYALFMKLLASEIVAFFHKVPTPLQKMMQATTSNKLRREMEDLEQGSIFRHLNITNFLEGDLFAWYTFVWDESIEQLVRAMVARLDDYNPGTLSEDPAGSRDLLKKLYQQLFPKSVRHDLGEYYTPDWLAEHVLNEVGYEGDPDKRLLDPSCGSGTFLVMAINRIRKWYEDNRERVPFDEGDLCRKILSNVIGFDLNPLAVMAARTNYLIAIRDLIGHVDKVEIPVYLCDSIMTPSEYGGLFAGELGKTKELKTAAARFLIPTEIASSREDVAKYAEQLEFCVINRYSSAEFIERCQDEGLPISEKLLHRDLYEELVKLDKANKNGVWARIIKNAFAPLFTGKVDYIAGNPPWVNWESLPTDYRDSMKHLWQDYGLFTLSGSAGRLGGGKKDLSMLFVYAGVDN